MPKGPLGNNRLTNVGPFTYDQSKPPEAPDSFSPPSEITNAFGDFNWWKRWRDEPIDKYGATMLYDVDNDRMFIDNRLDGPNGGDYLHDDMVVDIIEKGPFPRFPDVSIPAEGGFVKTDNGSKGSVEVPTAAGGAWVVTRRLPSDKEFLEDGKNVSINQFYKFVYALRMIDFPEETLVRAKHHLGTRIGNTFQADRMFKMKDAYRELSFINQLPEPKVESPVNNA